MISVNSKDRILPAHIRNNPFANPPPITEDDIKCGMYNLVNRRVIPKDVDLTPAFETEMSSSNVFLDTGASHHAN